MKQSPANTPLQPRHSPGVLATIIIVLMIGCGVPSMQEGKSPFQDDEPTEATLFAPGVVSDPGSSEFGISFTPDARTAYFTSKKPEDRFYAIYVANYQDGQWRGPTVAPFSGEYFDGDAFVTADGSRLFFFSMRPVTDTL